MKFVNRELCARYQRFFAHTDQQRIEAVQKQYPEMKAQAWPVTGGWATHDGVGSWNTQIVGWGSSSDVSDSELDEVLQRFDDLPGEVRVHAAILGDKTLFPRLEDRGFRVRGHVVFCGREITDRDREFTPTSGLEIRSAFPEEELIWSETLNRGFMSVEAGAIDKDLEPLARSLFHSDSIIPSLALDRGKAVGAAALDIEGDLAYLSGAATLPSMRRRGAQGDLQRYRIAHAAELGAKEILFAALAGTSSLNNAMKLGMEILYTAAILTRNPVPEELL